MPLIIMLALQTLELGQLFWSDFSIIVDIDYSWAITIAVNFDTVLSITNCNNVVLIRCPGYKQIQCSLNSK